MSKSSSTNNESKIDGYDLRQKAIDSLLNESKKRKQLSDRMGSEAFYIQRYCPAKADVDFLNRHIRRVTGHNKRWVRDLYSFITIQEEDKCYTIKRNMEKLKREKRDRPREDKYKQEKEYWQVEKAMKFANKEDDKSTIVQDLGIDRSNIFLFPTVTSCSSSDDDKKEEEQQQKHHHHHKHHHHKHNHKSS